MSKYRKKPVMIEAELYDGTLDSAHKISKWAGKAFDWTGSSEYITIPTLEGDMTAQKGDWIIRGVKGEFYPCKPDIFEATYEPVEPNGARKGQEK